MRKIILRLFMISILFSFASCGGGNDTTYCDNIESESGIATTKTGLVTSFSDIIAQYAMLEQNGFVDERRKYSPNVGQLHPITWRYNMGMLPSYWRLLYAFYDLSGDGQSELIIGAVGSMGFFPYIVAIYAMVDGVPVLIKEYCGGRPSMHLSRDGNDDVVLLETWGHMGNAQEAFYYVGDGGYLILSKSISTYDFDREHYSATGDLIRTRYFYSAGNRVYLTEPEYADIIQFFGAFGYEVEADISTRPVELSWQPLRTLNEVDSKK